MYITKTDIGTQNSHSADWLTEKSTRLITLLTVAMVRSQMNQRCWRP